MGKTTIISALKPAALATSVFLATSAISYGADIPSRGMTQQDVLEKFGTPLKKTDPVGSPPISRWRYDDYTVYFEGQYVIHSVEDAKLGRAVTHQAPVESAPESPAAPAPQPAAIESAETGSIEPEVAEPEEMSDSTPEPVLDAGVTETPEQSQEAVEETPSTTGSSGGFSLEWNTEPAAAETAAEIQTPAPAAPVESLQPESSEKKGFFSRWKEKRAAKKRAREEAEADARRQQFEAYEAHLEATSAAEETAPVTPVETNSGESSVESPAIDGNQDDISAPEEATTSEYSIEEAATAIEEASDTDELSFPPGFEAPEETDMQETSSEVIETGISPESSEDIEASSTTDYSDSTTSSTNNATEASFSWEPDYGTSESSASSENEEPVESAATEKSSAADQLDTTDQPADETDFTSEISAGEGEPTFRFDPATGRIIMVPPGGETEVAEPETSSDSAEPQPSDNAGE